MQETTLSELRNQTRHFFDLIEAGETIRVLRNGKPIADIMPVQKDVPSWKRRQAQPLLVDGVEISRLILEDRGC
ncbi:MAG: type II toxin-antitoxin system Phd/YefM family antitoxin [Desulfocapsaceae bacterium]|nr:type II toxin-antitoxin system Phd/YefM family antitoxin [Desulfocapsaceae bacterium]